MGEHTADDVLEHLGRRATVEGTARWLGQVTLFQVVDDLNGAGEIKDLLSRSNLELVAVEVAGDDESLATDDNDLLALEQALGDGGGQATHKVLVTIDDFDSVESVHVG